MTTHLYYQHQCAKCDTHYLPYAKDVPCPKCGEVEEESVDILSQLVAALKSNREWYGAFQPPAFVILTLSDHHLNFLAGIFDHFEEERGRDFPSFLEDISKRWDVKGEECLRGYVKALTLKVREAFDRE